MDKRCIENTKEKPRYFRKSVAYIGCTALVLLLSGIGFTTIIGGVSLVQGKSMEPTLVDGDWIYVDKRVEFDDIERGDIIVFKSKNNYKEYYTKRVIGLPHDIIEITNGDVILNGTVLEEDYISNNMTNVYGESSWIVPSKSLFVLGDNRQLLASEDSRLFGCIRKEAIVGVVKHIISK